MRHIQYFQKLVAAVLRSPGATDPRLREAVAARAVEAAGGPPASSPLSPDIADIAPLVEKVARHAHRVTEDDLDALRRAGYSEDALFEITVAGALGAGRARLERGLAALRGEERGER